MKWIKATALAGMIGVTMVAPTIADASTSSAVYDSTPVKGTVSVPSHGPEAYSFNQIGNEVIRRPHTAAIRHIRVTLVSWSCQSGTCAARRRLHHDTRARRSRPLSRSICIAPARVTRTGKVILARRS